MCTAPTVTNCRNAKLTPMPTSRGDVVGALCRQRHFQGAMVSESPATGVRA